MFPQIVQVKRAIESLYDATCRISALKNVTDADSHRMSYKIAELYDKDFPCHVNVTNNNFPAVTNGGVAPGSLSQTITLFLPPDVQVPEGSFITVTSREGLKTEYEASGVPVVFAHHQEITLTLRKEHP